MTGRRRRLLPVLVAAAIAAVAVFSASAQDADQISVGDGRFQQFGEPVTLHGVNVEVLEFFRQDDFDAMAAAGFDHVRLRVHWTELQPDAPVRDGDDWIRTFDRDGLDRIIRYVGMARTAGMDTIVDNHDCYFCTTSGFPQWLTRAAYNSRGRSYSTADRSELRAWQEDGWTDAERIQHMGEYLVWLANNLEDVPGIIGYEVLNEPQPGSLGPTPATTVLMASVQLQWAQRIRAADPDRVIFFQTRYGYLPGLDLIDLAAWAELGNVAADLHNGFGARWGVGLDDDPNSDGYRNDLQKVNNNVNSATVAPYFGTVTAQRNHVLDRLESLEPYGIALHVGEFGWSGETGRANHGTILAAMCQVGDHRVSWAHRDWAGPQGMVTNAGEAQPWADLVLDALARPCPGDV